MIRLYFIDTYFFIVRYLALRKERMDIHNIYCLKIVDDLKYVLSKA